MGKVDCHESPLREQVLCTVQQVEGTVGTV